MKGAVIHGPRDVRYEEVPQPKIEKPTDAIIRTSVTSVCGSDLFRRHVYLHGGPAPVRHYLPELIRLVLNGAIDPGKVFDLELPLAQVAEGYQAMDERRAIKTLLRP